MKNVKRVSKKDTNISWHHKDNNRSCTSTRPSIHSSIYWNDV